MKPDKGINVSVTEVQDGLFVAVCDRYPDLKASAESESKSVEILFKSINVLDNENEWERYKRLLCEVNKTVDACKRSTKVAELHDAEYRLLEKIWEQLRARPQNCHTPEGVSAARDNEEY